jgi:hypothetical protein
MHGAPPDNLHQHQCKYQQGRIGLETRANTREGNLGTKAAKIPIGTCVWWVGLSFPDGEVLGASTRIEMS